MRLFLCLLALCWVSSADYLPCTSGYSRLNQQNGLSFCFKIYTQLYTRDQAASTCAGDGATLANIQTLEANSMVATVNPSLGTIFIGVKCFSNNTCLYDDGSAVTNPGLFFFGGISTPNVGNCVVLATSGSFTAKWFSISCTTPNAFVCQQDVDGPYLLFLKNSAPLRTMLYKRKYILSPLRLLLQIFRIYTATTRLVRTTSDSTVSCSEELFIKGPFLINFTTFNTENTYDFVEFYTGSNRTSLTYYTRTSGNWGPWTYETNPCLMLIFTTDVSNTYPGFAAKITHSR